MKVKDQVRSGSFASMIKTISRGFAKYKNRSSPSLVKRFCSDYRKIKADSTVNQLLILVSSFSVLFSLLLLCWPLCHLRVYVMVSG